MSAARFVALPERVRNAWAHRCLVCLFNPFHGGDETILRCPWGTANSQEPPA